MPVIREIKEESERKETEEYGKESLRMDLENYNELLGQNTELVYVLEQEIKELNDCEDKDREEFVKDMIEGLKQDIKRNVNIQTQLLERILNY